MHQIKCVCLSLVGAIVLSVLCLTRGAENPNAHVEPPVPGLIAMVKSLEGELKEIKSNAAPKLRLAREPRSICNVEFTNGKSYVKSNFIAADVTDVDVTPKEANGK